MQWLSDLDAGRAASTLISPYQDTGGVRVNEDGMVEVLVAPYQDDNDNLPVAAGKQIDEESAEGVSTRKPLGLGDVVVDRNRQPPLNLLPRENSSKTWQVVPTIPPERRFPDLMPGGESRVYGCRKRRRAESAEAETMEQQPAQETEYR